MILHQGTYTRKVLERESGRENHESYFGAGPVGWREVSRSLEPGGVRGSLAELPWLLIVVGSGGTNSHRAWGHRRGSES